VHEFSAVLQGPAMPEAVFFAAGPAETATGREGIKLGGCGDNCVVHRLGNGPIDSSQITIRYLEAVFFGIG
jgi:hypothetical protein